MKYILLVLSIVILITLIFSAKANRDHVRAYAELENQLNTYKDVNANQAEENKVLCDKLRVMVSTHAAKISSQDVKIKELIQVVLELYKIIQYNAEHLGRIT